VLDIECLDRVLLNAYVPNLQSSGQVVAFMTQHLGMPIASPALMEKISTRFRRGVESFASANGIAWVRFAKADRKLEVMQEYLDRQAATGRSACRSREAPVWSYRTVAAGRRASGFLRVPQWRSGVEGSAGTCYRRAVTSHL